MKLLFAIFCLLSISLTVQAAAVNKKNVCTVTINSSEEAELFKANLSPDLWNFIELAPKQEGEASKEWFAESCKANVKCDILIVSGHFGGTFFGSSKLTLSVADLERNSCKKECDGILKQPKEVFLFGCNTLASKEKDQRTPEQYMQVLMADGFSLAQASQIVSFRYSGFGDSFKRSMAQVFSSTPRIYGFSSIGPSGKTVEPLLKSYLQSSKKEYDNFDQYAQSSGIKLNQKLQTALKNTSLTQAEGLLLNIKQAEEKPYCYIRSEKISRLEKMRYIHKLFEDKRAIQLLTHIQDFLHEIKKNTETLSQDERKVWDSFASDPKVKADLLELLKLKGDIYMPLKTNVLNTVKDLNLVTDQFVINAFNQMLDLNSPFDRTRMDMLCGVQVNINVPVEAIPKARWSEPYFISSLLCLRPDAPAVKKNLIEAFQHSPDVSIRASALWYFYWVKPADLETQRTIVNILFTEKDVTVLQSAAMVLKAIKPEAPVLKQLIQDAAQVQSNEYVLRHLRGIYN